MKEKMKMTNWKKEKRELEGMIAENDFLLSFGV